MLGIHININTFSLGLHWNANYMNAETCSYHQRITDMSKQFTGYLV